MQLKLKLCLLSSLFVLQSANAASIEAVPSSASTQAIPSYIITNGTQAEVGAVPYIVGLLLKDGGASRWCGGSIIGHNWVLTAAHCTDYIDSVTISYGATKREEPLFTLEVSVENITQHPRWPESMSYDIALIRTPYVSFWGMVNKIRLPGLRQRSESFEHAKAVTCGWGTTYDGSSLPEWLQCVELPIISNELCSHSYEELPEHVLCVDTHNGKSICDGDSGGPLVTKEKPRLVGITSFSDLSSCMSAVPAGFTRVTAHLNWIRKVSGISYK